MSGFEELSSFFLSTLRLSIPLVLAALGGYYSERSGVINIGLEGKMLVGALAAAILTHFSQSPYIGLLAGAGAGMFWALLYAIFVLELRSQQIVAGMAMNLLAAGVAPFVCKILFDVTGSTPALAMSERLHSLPIVLTLGVWAFTEWVHRGSVFGLRLRFAGEKPDALLAAGVSHRALRWKTLALSGLLAGASGAVLSIALSSSFSRDMTAGRGFMALAALIFGKWNPTLTVLGCVFFGAMDALQIRMQGAAVPTQLIQMVPYLATLAVLAGFVGRARAPGALGKPSES
jgi:simple sugar transport system permease protein